MEILVPKILNQEDACYYSGVIAYGKAIDNKTYVLRIQFETDNKNVNKWFVICKAEQSEIQEIFREDDEMGEGLMFDYYDDAINGFQDFLESDCNLFN
jgi:hypothetical protein